MFINQFNFFKEELKENNFSDFELKKIMVNPNNKSWILNISVKLSLENINKLNLFSQKLQNFLKNKISNLIRDLEIKINFNFINLETFNNDIFRKLLLIIISNKKENEIFNILYNSFYSVDVKTKICTFNIDPIIIPYLKEPNILDKLQSLLSNNYGLNLKLTTNIQNQSSDQINYDVIDKSNIQNILKEIISNKKENEIFNILYNSFYSMDMKTKICTFQIDP
ncbi:hypothetical protein AXA84_0309, partial [Candidatus Phytoplasma oryzae]